MVLSMMRFLACTVALQALLPSSSVVSMDERRGPRRRLRQRGASSHFAGDATPRKSQDDPIIAHRRRLPPKQELKQTHGDQPDRSKFFLKRMVLYCDRIMDLDNCWEVISHMGENLRLVHHLPGLHALAVESDESTVEDLSNMGFYFSEDMERETLALKESLRYHDSRFLSQQGQQTSYALDLIRATQVWSQYEVRGEGARVCIIDTGVYAKHPDFEDSHLNGWNSTDDFITPWSEDLLGHGTFVTGILAASDNDRGYVGVAPGVEVYFIRVFTDEGLFYGSDVVAAAEACRVAGANFISMSLGGYGFDEGEHEMFKDLYVNHGIISVASAGNTGGPELTFPASYNYVVSVAACDSEKKVSSFSTFNSFVDIAAPGENIPSTYIVSGVDDSSEEGVYASLSGTSMAVPHVVGTLALMKSFAPKATADELLYALTHSTQPLATKIYLGLVDAFAAVQMLEAGVNISDATSAPCLEVQLSIETDQWGEETAYRLRRISDDSVLWKGIGLESYMEYMESTCVNPNDCYEFIIRDSYGDGIVEPGRIKLMYGGQVELDYGGFGRGGKLLFGDAC